ncbi:MAG: hypothetical protein A2655_01210 [Candidatus Yanofskybacteria bacterium RIFCSPHIGHO2_01_FULL_43_42]|uniref:Uncharacterized protein n=1 Tax=Candidatus Yanofskybacteria bacterium RIFCSPLOWO2_01_FULL_43_22 TaxID=1802695 RepID=A0A1F8GGG3_9BACT|nr:MAG: hypothetical protein A2655_01210 [Candidatus Yanofskybacteria bacterium RIFCSPHIGHO2_01_FULL_43_42]OGN13813.1 MAG: hypothetical protein A3D48_00480 [Candidatus Yanofskybacteria bacterium RIFCSPHIGHO2_02_FULL_43_17]OGN23796.1 MAG: hypothetical protein A3A13_01995 [Candidatus Yanofskybacteria bacterium RIFCSPLOWO2_01_FULL_43_22]
MSSLKECKAGLASFSDSRTQKLGQGREISQGMKPEHPVTLTPLGQNRWGEIAGTTGPGSTSPRGGVFIYILNSAAARVAELKFEYAIQVTTY